MAIKGHLNPRNVVPFLKEIVDYVGGQWNGVEQKLIEGRQLRYDLAFRYASKAFTVDWDGPDHYQNDPKLIKDEEKDELARKQGFRVVRIPYWLQLDSVMLKFYSQIDVVIDRKPCRFTDFQKRKRIEVFPHGFITTKVRTASFCPKGIERFKRELDSLPVVVREEVMRSLDETL